MRRMEAKIASIRVAGQAKEGEAQYEKVGQGGFFPFRSRSIIAMDQLRGNHR